MSKLKDRIKEKLNVESILLGFLVSFPLAFILGYSNWDKGIEDFMDLFGYGGTAWLHIVIVCLMWIVLAAFSWLFGVSLLGEERAMLRSAGMAVLAIVTGVSFILAIETYGEYINTLNILYMFEDRAAERLMNWSGKHMTVAEIAAGFSAIIWVGMILSSIGRVLFSTKIGSIIGWAAITFLFFLPGIWSWRTGRNLEDAKYVYGGLLLIGLVVVIYLVLRQLFQRMSASGRGTLGYVFGRIVDLILLIALVGSPFYFVYREGLGLKWAIIAALIAPAVGSAFYFSQSRKRQIF